MQHADHRIKIKLIHNRYTRVFAVAVQTHSITLSALPPTKPIPISRSRIHTNYVYLTKSERAKKNPHKKKVAIQKASLS